MSDKRITEAMAVLERGEAVPCPWCGEKYDTDSNTACYWQWDCKSWLLRDGSYERTAECYEAEIARLRDLLREAERYLRAAREDA